MLKKGRKNSIRAFLKNTAGNLSLAVSRFGKDTRGNFAVMFGLASVPILGFTGLAVEFTRYSMVNESLTNSLDASGLAISQRAEALGWDIADLSDQQVSDLKDYGKEFFDANFSDNSDIKNLTVDFIFTATTVTPTASGHMDTSLMSLLGVDKFNMDNSTEITLQGAGRLELALVLDVTGSMGFNASGGGGNSRMDVLQDAVEDMMDSLYGSADDATNENVKVAVVPFNTTVNTGWNETDQASWLDLDAEAMFHGNNFIHIEDIYDIDATDKVNHFELFDSIGTETSWKGCVESLPFPLDELDVVPGSTVSTSTVNAYDDLPSSYDSSVATEVQDAFNNAPSLPYSAATVGASVNTKFVPYFWPDEPDCYFTCEYNVFSSTYPSVSDTSWPGYMFDEINEDGDSESQYYNRWFIDDYRYIDAIYADDDAFDSYFQVVCQYRFNEAGTRTELCDDLPLTTDSDWATIIAKTNATDSGSEEYRMRAYYPGIYNTSTNQYEGKYDLPPWIVESGETAGRGPNYFCSTPIQPLTTDKSDVMDTVDVLNPSGSTNTSIGAIWGWRVLTNQAPFTEGAPDSDTDWRKAVVLMTDGENDLYGANSHPRGSDYYTYGYFDEERLNVGTGESAHETEATRKTIRICRRMHDAGIKVYTVGFSITSGGTADKMLEACASVPSGDNKTYFLAQNANQLEQAFQDITEDLVNLHISG